MISKVFKKKWFFEKWFPPEGGCTEPMGAFKVGTEVRGASKVGREVKDHLADLFRPVL